MRILAKGIVSDPHVLGGRARIEETRVLAASVMELNRKGMKRPAVMQFLGIQRHQYHAAIAYITTRQIAAGKRRRK